MSREFSEEELRAIEAEMERLTVDDVMLQTLVTLVNLGARKAGLAAPPPGERDGAAGEPEPKRDLEQTRQAIDGARALLPLLEARHGQELAPVKDAIARLQIAYVQLSGGSSRRRAAEAARAAARHRSGTELRAAVGPRPVAHGRLPALHGGPTRAAVSLCLSPERSSCQIS